ILEQSEKFRVKRILSINLSLGKELLGMKLPDEVLNRIESDKSARAISTSIKEKFYINKNISTVHKEAFSRFKVRENRLDGLKDYLKVQLLDELKLFGGPKERIPFIPTPEEVVNRMLELAEPGPGDIIYDLGCGDGRIVITAAREYGIPGVGVDLDPRCIEESRKNAKKEGVEQRTTFIKEDVMKVDISKATILALYMGFDTNIKLIPKIKKHLKPGTRIVSHRFPMGEWNPVKSDIMYYKGTIVPI
ncbi:MAG TPA: methyltransferase domain-containing protein, partial [Methanobacterium sp.]